MISFFLISFFGMGGLLSIPPAPAQISVNLYFLDDTRSHLASQPSKIPEGLGVMQSARAILTDLMKGPKQELIRSIPEELSLRSVFVTEEKIAYVDLVRSRDAELYQDVLSEWLTVFSIVNTLILNLPEIESVKLLIGGREAETLSGHVDLSYPFKANLLLIR